jgi:hypothetical protein
MMSLRKKRLAIAVAGVLSLGASTAPAVDFSATATVQNTLTVVSLLDFDLGTVFAPPTGVALVNGVGALVISPAGAVSVPAAVSATVALNSLSTPVPAQGSVAMTTDFNLVLPDTRRALPADFTADAGSSLATLAGGTANATVLAHSSGDPSVPSLYLMHFTIGDVSGGTAGTETATYDGGFPITQAFGESSYVFNIGATLVTEPGTGTALAYQEGVYAGTFAVTAEY